MLYSQFVCSSLGKTIFPTLSNSLIACCCIGLEPHRLPPSTSAYPLLALVKVMFKQSRWWDFMAVAPESPRRHSLTANALVSWLLQSFLPFLKCSLNLRYKRCIDDVSSGPELHNSAFWLVVFFCNDLCLLQRGSSLMKGENSLICGYKTKYLEHSKGLWWFSEVLLVGFPLRPVNSLGFWFEAGFPSCWTNLKSN